GGYAERTAQYHAIVLDDALLALQLGRARDATIPGELEPTLRRMSHWLARVVRNDHSVPYLNDAAPDAFPEIAPLLARARSLGVAAHHPTQRGPFDLAATGW